MSEEIRQKTIDKLEQAAKCSYVNLDKIINEIEREADYQNAMVSADIARGMYKTIKIIEKYKERA